MQSCLPDRHHASIRRPVAGLMLAALTALVLLAPSRLQARTLWGDEGTYVAMTESLRRDLDLLFDERDRDWALKRQPDQPVTVILQDASRGVAYSKPILYPLLSLPLYALLGEAGMIATQCLVLAAALWLAWIFLRGLGGSIQALGTMLTLLAGSVVLVYATWKMSDLLLFSLVLAGLVLCLGRPPDPSHRSAAVSRHFSARSSAALGGVLLGAATSMRYPIAALVAAAVLALLLEGRQRRAGVTAATALATLGALTLLTLSLIGSANPYKSVRSSFNLETGYPAGESMETARSGFSRRAATQSATWRPSPDWRRTAYSSLYFLCGRHTGLLLYFPVALGLLLTILRRPGRRSLALLLGLVVMVGFYLVWMPQNYFGGSTFVGNRYFLAGLPALVVALPRLPKKRTLAAVALLALMSWSSAFASLRSFSDLDRSSQAHAFAGVFRWLPFESTAQRIDGLSERFWADDYIRFLDPYSRVAAWSFRLDSRRPAAEVLVATTWSGDPLRFVIAAESSQTELTISDWSQSQRLEIPQEPPAAPGLLEISLSPPWRQHAFWWKASKPYSVRVFRFSLHSPSSEATAAVVRYVGRGRELSPLEGSLLAPDPTLTMSVTATEVSALDLRLLNTGRRPWKSFGLFPVHLGYRLVPRDGGGGGASASPGLLLPENVRPGGEIVIRLDLRWPSAPGPYDLVLELFREPRHALGGSAASRLAVIPVEVRPGFSPDSREP